MEHELFQSDLKPWADTTSLSKMIRSASSTHKARIVLRQVRTIVRFTDPPEVCKRYRCSAIRGSPTRCYELPVNRSCCGTEMSDLQLRTTTKPAPVRCLLWVLFRGDGHHEVRWLPCDHRDQRHRYLHQLSQEVQVM